MHTNASAQRTVSKGGDLGRNVRTQEGPVPHFAGLDDEQNVVCGNRACDQRLGEVVASSGGYDRAYQRYVTLGSGWEQADGGTWKLTDHARKRYERDRKRAVHMDGLQARQRLRNGKTIRHHHAVVVPADPGTGTIPANAASSIMISRPCPPTSCVRSAEP